MVGCAWPGVAADRRVIILASASATRAAILRNAGVEFEAMPAHIDESAIKHAGAAAGEAPGAVAQTLARLKAQRIAARWPDALVIGADQILSVGDVWLDKPESVTEAADHLRRLRGQTHTLHTAVCCLRDRQMIWQHIAAPTLTMRAVPDDFIADYLAAEGDDCLSSVGAYRLEGRGIQLFERIDGDYFSILGLPILPLLGFLRQHGTLR
ncbi:nucleoside triphosphate pyrophosphatase [Acidiphilium sp. MT5]